MQTRSILHLARTNTAPQPVGNVPAAKGSKWKSAGKARGKAAKSSEEGSCNAKGKGGKVSNPAFSAIGADDVLPARCVNMLS